MTLSAIDGARGVRIEAVAGLADAVRAACRGDSMWATRLFDEAPAANDDRPAGRAPLRRLELHPACGRSELLVRRGLRGGWMGPWLGDRHASPRRVRGELRVAVALLERGAPVCEPAFCAYRRSGATWQTAFASVRLPGARDLRMLLESEGRAELAAADALAIARAVGIAIRAFHDAGGSHADLNLGNVVVSQAQQPVAESRNASGYRAWLVDLDRSSCAAPPPPRTRVRELLRLRRSLRKLHGDQPRTVAACFSAYCRGERVLRRQLLAAAIPEWKRLRRHERWRFA